MTADELRAARLALKLSQRELAALVGVNWRTVAGWEAGSRNHKPTVVPKPVAVILQSAEVQEDPLAAAWRVKV